MSQQQLLNTRGMSSAREMRKLRRDREVTRLRLQRKLKMPVDNKYPGPVTSEFVMPDEDRDFTLAALKCWMCSTKGSIYMRKVTHKPENLTTFQLYCQCGNQSAEFPKSQHALQYWRVMLALNK